jgi:hypothetical protein
MSYTCSYIEKRMRDCHEGTATGIRVSQVSLSVLCACCRECANFTHTVQAGGIELSTQKRVFGEGTSKENWWHNVLSITELDMCEWILRHRGSTACLPRSEKPSLTRRQVLFQVYFHLTPFLPIYFLKINLNIIFCSYNSAGMRKLKMSSLFCLVNNSVICFYRYILLNHVLLDFVKPVTFDRSFFVTVK